VEDAEDDRGRPGRRIASIGRSKPAGGFRQQRNGRHEETRTPDLYRVKNEVINLKPFACFAFPNFTRLQNPRKLLVFGDEFVTSF